MKFDFALTVPGSSNSKAKLTFTVLDKNIFSATTYYGLKQTDYDRKMSFYVGTHKLENNDVVLLPNPASDYLNATNVEGRSIAIQILKWPERDVELQKVLTEMETKSDISPSS